MEQGDAVLSFVRRRLKALVGEDPLMTERLWRLIWEIDRIDEMQLCQLAILDLDRLGHQIQNGGPAALPAVGRPPQRACRLTRRP